MNYVQHYTATDEAMSDANSNNLAWAINAALEESEKRTRRERIATAALQGFLASWREGMNFKPDITARSAVKFADALIAELDKP